MFTNLFKKSLTVLAVATTVSVTSLSSSLYAGNTQDRLHKDFRKTHKIDFVAGETFKTALSNQDQALEFLSHSKQKYGLESTFESLKFKRVKSSLLGKHYYFQQYLNDVQVDKAEIIVSINKDEQVYRVFNNTFPVTKDIIKTSKTLLGKTTAEQKVWDFLQVSGKLQGLPKSNLIYINLGANFKLAYKVNMTVTQPFGDWEFYLDAVSGAVITATRIDLPTFKNANANSLSGKWQKFKTNANHTNFKEALASVNLENKRAVDDPVNKADATALVFDPDPVTTLNNDSLEDTSSAASFDAAYETRTLSDVTLNNGTYSLTGPWVTIADFESPTTAPSTSSTGNWTAKRGDNSFNDAMTYFHIDQNQRYMQSLGFVDATGIQFLSISVDTDGLSGDDNSHFIPSTNQLAFGHGCVDDNEDVDVILHEYGHAINTSINSNWSGGDTGAMGEGFGDYWAASYSYSTPNGRTVHPEWAFSWDGHNNCWPGRLLNQTTHRYDSNSTYGAHQTVGGINGDELWSTPLAESLITLLDEGVSRNEVDQIILEAQFGLGSGLKMPDLAAAIVSTAVTLFPSGTHSSVFDSNFKMMEILGDSLSVDQVTVVSAGDNTVADPGETLSLNVSLKNTGGTTLSAISTTLSSSTSGVTFGTPAGSYADIAASQSATNVTPYEFSIPASHVCGADIALSLDANYTDGTAQSGTYAFTLPVGLGNDVIQSSSPGTSIPDNNTTGITEQLTLSGAIADSNISVDMNITHTYRGDLTLTLTSPAGTSVILQTSSSDSAADIIGVYPTTLTPANSLSAFDNEDHEGTWTLAIVDSGPADLGTLNSWAIISTSPAVCNSNEAPVAAVVNSTISATEGDNVIIDATPSSDPEGDPLTFAWSQTSGETVTINNATSAQANFDIPTINATEVLIFEVVVSDDQGGSNSETVEVTVADAAGNSAPVANVASANITVTEGDTATLDASSSSDPDGDTLTYLWTQISGTSVTLSNANTAQAIFNADVSGSFAFQISVTDPSGATDNNSVNVTVNPPNQAPTASASAPSSVNEGSSVTLNASASSDPDGDTLTYEWTQTSGTSVSLNNNTSAQATFTAPAVTAATTLQFSVTVSDPDSETSTASVTVTINDVPESSGGGGGSFSWLSLLLIGFLRRATIILQKS
ncbi:MAG: subtilisin-like proprotein convertase family protein/Zn-dependent metalloprotease [Polaribacter sp.]|jgi:subtilisin-like proprotein convertase family protein/Zn-dependent metalloprotease